MMGVILMIISAALSPFFIVLAIHFYARFKFTNQALKDEKIKLQNIANKIVKLETESDTIRKELRTLKSASTPKWTTDPRKMTFEQLERCVNYFVENYNKVKS